MRKMRLERPIETSTIKVVRQGAIVFVEFGFSSIYEAYTVVVNRKVIRSILFSLAAQKTKEIIVFNIILIMSHNYYLIYISNNI